MDFFINNQPSNIYDIGSLYFAFISSLAFSNVNPSVQKKKKNTATYRCAYSDAVYRIIATMSRYELFRTMKRFVLRHISQVSVTLMTKTNAITIYKITATRPQ